MDLEPYRQQLTQINNLLQSTSAGSERDELVALKHNIEELLSLTHEEDSLKDHTEENSQNDALQDEFALFMAEMQQVGALDKATTSKTDTETKNYKYLEGKKFKAPHNHHFGQTVYHNCMVCSVPMEEIPITEDFEVKVLFLNPTHKEMLPCPYFFNLETNCKFSDEKCNFSHGEIVLFSSLQPYIEPKFENLTIGSSVLAKQNNNLWSRAKIKNIAKEKCLVAFEHKTQQDENLEFEDILPLEKDSNISDTSEESDLSDNEDIQAKTEQDFINMSLLNTPSSEALGDWEKHTKGVGSKLMQKMGYIVGTGLGRDGSGRIDPVTAVILPPGKSLDYCMKLRDKHGGDQNLFSAEKKMKRLQRRAQLRSEKSYKKSQEKTDFFTLINTSLNTSKITEIDERNTKRQFRENLKTNTERELNVQNFVLHEDIKKREKNIETYRIALTRHKDTDSEAHKNLMKKIHLEQTEMRKMEAKVVSIQNEQQIRSDKKKLTIF